MHSAVGAGIEYMTGTKVDSVDIKNKTLKIASGGEDITYDKLIIATGSTVSFQPCTITLYVFSCCSTHKILDRSKALPSQQMGFTSLLQWQVSWVCYGCRT